MVSVNQPELEESYLTVAEVAELLKLNQQTVRNWIDQGSLPALRVGRRVRIKRSDFERVLAEGYSGRARPPAPAPGAAGAPDGATAPGPSSMRGLSSVADPPSVPGGPGEATAPGAPSAEDFWGGEAVGVAEAPPSSPFGSVGA